MRTRGQHNTGIYDMWDYGCFKTKCQNFNVSSSFSLVRAHETIPRLDQPIRPPPLKPPLPLSAAEDVKKRPELAKKCFVWSEYKESGFSSRVSHATVLSSEGKRYM